MEYDNELQGVIFKQAEKQHAKSPDYWGKAQVSGVEYKLAGWIKEGKKGKFISIKLTAPGVDPGMNRRDDPPMPVGDPLDVPF